MRSDLELIILTPNGELARVPCDSVRLFARDNEAGEGGGSIGIRKGRLPAVAALEPGSKAEARLAGELVYKTRVPGGFAMVKDDTVTVLTDSIEKGESEDAPLL